MNDGRYDGGVYPATQVNVNPSTVVPKSPGVSVGAEPCDEVELDIEVVVRVAEFFEVGFVCAGLVPHAASSAQASPPDSTARNQRPAVTPFTGQPPPCWRTSP